MHAFVVLLCGLLVAMQPARAVEPAAKPDAAAGAATAADPAAVKDAATPADPAAIKDASGVAAPDPAAPAAPVATAVPEDKGLPGREGEILPRLPALASDEELVWLNAEGARFFAFRRPPPNGKTPRGAVLIVPDPRAFIDQQAVTRALRDIPARGAWLTLALQVPLAATPAAPQPPTPPPADPANPPATPPVVAAASSTTDPLCGRLAAALALLESTSPPLIALVAQDDNAARALACYPDGLPPGIGAFAAIGRWAGKLEGLKIPSIEFVASLDPVGRREAARRAAAPRGANAPPHRMVELDAATRAFGGAEEDLAKRLRGWLERLPVPPPAADKPAKVSS